MEVVILCGGMGTRIGEVTDNKVPKPMVPIGGKPILWHIMQQYGRAGHRSFILCAGHLSWQIKDFFLNYQARHADITICMGEDPSIILHQHDAVEDWRVTIAETGEGTMTAGRISRIKDYITGDRFMLTYGDGVSDVDFADLERFHSKHGKLISITGVIPPGRFGELTIRGDHVVEMQEKPEEQDRYINGGFMIVEKRFVDKYIGPNPDSVMLEHDPLTNASRAGELMVYKHSGFWQCMDTPRDWATLNNLWKSGIAPWAK
jgi:glucose-1-phosphate cytidylyltransferase